MIMSRASDIALRVFAGFGVISFSLIMALVIMKTWKMPAHQFHLWKLSRNLQEIDPFHPLDAELVAKVRNLGDFANSSSYSCNYLVGEIRSTKYAQDDVRLGYSGVFVDTSDGTGHLPVEVHFFDEEEFSMAYPWDGWRANLHRSFGTFVKFDNVYAVFVSQAIRTPYGDIRCR